MNCRYAIQSSEPFSLPTLLTGSSATDIHACSVCLHRNCLWKSSPNRPRRYALAVSTHESVDFVVSVLCLNPAFRLRFMVCLSAYSAAHCRPPRQSCVVRSRALQPAAQRRSLAMCLRGSGVCSRRTSCRRCAGTTWRHAAAPSSVRVRNTPFVALLTFSFARSDMFCADLVRYSVALSLHSIASFSLLFPSAR